MNGKEQAICTRGAGWPLIDYCKGTAEAALYWVPGRVLGAFYTRMPLGLHQREFHFKDKLEARSKSGAWPKLSQSPFYYFVVTRKEGRHNWERTEHLWRWHSQIYPSVPRKRGGGGGRGGSFHSQSFSDIRGSHSFRYCCISPHFLFYWGHSRLL